MTIAEVARLIGKSEQSIRRAIRSGKLRATMADGRYEVDGNDIPDSLRDSQSIVTDSHGVNHVDSQALVSEIEQLKQRISELEDRLKEKDRSLEEARRAADETGQRHDTIVLQLTRQLEQSQLLLEYHQEPWYQRWFRKKKVQEER